MVSPKDALFLSASCDMREIDEVRIVLLRLLSDTAQFPSALIDQILKASEFVKRHISSIKVNAYGRGLLTRYRQHSLYVKNFNRQAHFQKATGARARGKGRNLKRQKGVT